MDQKYPKCAADCKVVSYCQANIRGTCLPWLNATSSRACICDLEYFQAGIWYENKRTIR